MCFFLNTLCYLAIIKFLYLWHSYKWKMLSCIFNLFVLIVGLIMCSWDIIFLWTAYLVHLDIILWLIYLFHVKFVRVWYIWENLALFLSHVRYFPRIVLYIFDTAYYIFAIWWIYFKMKKIWAMSKNWLYYLSQIIYVIALNYYFIK